jgi:hypothetical protein
MITLNVQNASQGGVAVLILITEIFIWTYLAPVTTISISCIPVRLRARSCGILILVMHVLGDIISPPIIGGISTKTGSLRAGLQVTWIAVFVSGAWWFCGYYFLNPFRPPKEDAVEEVSYYTLLCGKLDVERTALPRDEAPFDGDASSLELGDRTQVRLRGHKLKPGAEVGGPLDNEIPL